MTPGSVYKYSIKYSIEGQRSAAPRPSTATQIRRQDAAPFAQRRHKRQGGQMIRHAPVQHDDRRTTALLDCEQADAAAFNPQLAHFRNVLPAASREYDTAVATA
jgi:hypothetical protein